MTRKPIRLNGERYDSIHAAATALGKTRTDIYRGAARGLYEMEYIYETVVPTVIAIGWQAVGDHTVFTVRSDDPVRYGYRLFLNDAHGRLVSCEHSPLKYDSEDRAITAAKKEAERLENLL